MTRTASPELQDAQALHSINATGVLRGNLLLDARSQATVFAKVVAW